MKNSENILLNTFDIAPFDKIDDADYKPAIEAAIKEARLEIDAISNSIEEPTFKNTIAALDFAGYKLDRVTSVFFNINSAETNDKIQKTAQEISPLLSEFSNDITLNEALFKRVKAVYESRHQLDLTREEFVLLEKKYKGFESIVNSGYLLIGIY